jgi:hypothetical protein
MVATNAKKSSQTHQFVGIITRMKQLRSIAVLTLCVASASFVIFGCAGNGSNAVVSNGGSGGGSFAIVGTPSVEMTYIPGLNQVGELPVYGDPLNIRTAEKVQFQLVGYTATGARVVLPALDWVSGDSSGTFGSISGNTGIFTATSRQSAEAQVITCRYNGQDYSAEYAVKARQVRINGSVLDKVTGLPVRGVIVYFYDEDGIFINQAVSAYDGSFRAALPRTASRFQLFNDSIPNSYLRLMRFDSDGQATLTKPDFFNNRNSSGVVFPVFVNSELYDFMQFRRTGSGTDCKPPISNTAYDNSDYYLPSPILLFPNTEVDGSGNPLDPAVVGEGCSVGSLG